MQDYSFSTERLTLRSILLSDAKEIYGITHKHPSIFNYMTWSEPKSEKEVQDSIQEIQSKTDIQLAICVSETLIGVVTIRDFHWWQQESSKGSAFLSFWLSPEHGGKGYGTEMLKEICRFGFEDLHLRKIFAGIFSDNIPSRKLLEKTGFQLIGELRAQYTKELRTYDCLRYEILFEDIFPNRPLLAPPKKGREDRPYLPAPFKNIRTKNLSLRSISKKDTSDYLEITKNHPRVSEFMTWTSPKDLEDALYKCVQMRREGDMNIAITDPLSGIIIGKATLRNFRFKQRAVSKNSAFLSFWFIPEYNTPKYAQELLRVITDYSFNTLGLRKIIAGIFAKNETTKQQLESFGFVLIGRLRKHYVKNNTEHDSLRYELIPSDLS